MQLSWPGNTKAAHPTLAALFGSLAERPAGLLHFPCHTPGGVHHAHEEADVYRTHGLHDRVEEGHLHDRLSLTRVAQEVGSDGLVVGQALAHRDGDWLTDAATAAHAILEEDKCTLSVQVQHPCGQLACEEFFFHSGDTSGEIRSLHEGWTHGLIFVSTFMTVGSTASHGCAVS